MVKTEARLAWGTVCTWWGASTRLNRHEVPSRRWSVRVKGLAPIVPAAEKKQARRRSMDREGHMDAMVLYHIFHRRSSEDYMFISQVTWSSGEKELHARMMIVIDRRSSIVEVKWQWNGNAQGKGMICRAFPFTGLWLSRDVLGRI